MFFPARQDFYSSQLFGSSFIFEPLQYGFGNLFSTYESFDPPSTLRLKCASIPASHFYIKYMVFAAPYAHNPTGFVPQFHGDPMSVSEIGYSPGSESR